VVEADPLVELHEVVCGLLQRVRCRLGQLPVERSADDINIGGHAAAATAGSVDNGFTNWKHVGGGGSVLRDLKSDANEKLTN
jgi:hypothetical protein